jgi:hypothetical protein
MIFNPLNFPPYNHYQLSTMPPFLDLEACLSYGLTDALIPLCKLFGDATDYNPEYLAETSHTSPSGNTIPTVDEAYYTDGMVSSSVLPYIQNFTSWNQVYGRNLSGIIPIGQRFWDKYDPAKSGIESVNPAQAVTLSKEATLAAPYTIQIIVDLNNGKGSPLYHSVALLFGKVWNSYSNPPNPQTLINPIIWAYKITLIPKNMSNVKLVKNGTEWGFYVPAINGDSLVDKANNFGYALPVANGQPDWPSVVPDITIN